jgi:S1-C subfamily serine protease
MNIILILLATYLSKVDEEIIRLENDISPYVVALHTEKTNLIMSGTIVEKNYIATVGFIEIGQRVNIEDKFGNISKGEVVGRDPNTGIHLIKSEKDFRTPPIQAEINKGQVCYIYGNSFGSMGMVGMGFLQSPEGITFNLSVPLSPGNNGSGVFDSQGKLLGIVGGKVNLSVFPENLFPNTNNFAEIIKVNYVLNTVEQIKKIGVVKRAWLGVNIENNTPLNMGVVVKEVVKNSPAEKAGIKEGDIIIALNGNNISNLERLKEMILIEEPGKTVTLTIIRGKNKMEIPVKLEEAKEIGPDSSSDFKIEKITPKKFIEQREELKEVLKEKIRQMSEELERLKEELEKLK